MKIHVLFVFIVALIVGSCHKKSLPPKEEDPGPVFYFKGDVEGIPVSFDAGVDAYYMKSSYYLDSNSVYVFKSELKQKECTDNCGFGLTFLINDYKTSPSGVMYIDSTLTLASYQFNDGNLQPLLYTGNFMGHQTTQNTIFNWNFSDGGTANGINCSRTFKANTTYTTTLTTNSGTVLSHSNVFRVGNHVQTNLNVVKIAPYSVFNYKFSATNLTGVPPFTYSWEFGDGYTSPDQSPTHEYLIPNIYTPVLTVVDANHDTCVSYYKLPAINNPYGDVNFNAYFSPIQNTKALSTIGILVNDPKGNVYSLANVNQDEKNHFEIVSIENYKPADNSQVFKKIKIRFSCTVYNGTNSLHINDGEAIIAVAYKN